MNYPHKVPLFFFNDTATTEIYTLSLHDALPIWFVEAISNAIAATRLAPLRNSDRASATAAYEQDRKSTRLNSSHLVISYAVFCLKKKITYCNVKHKDDCKQSHSESHFACRQSLT